MIHDGDGLESLSWSNTSREWLETFEKLLGDISIQNNKDNDDSESGGSCNENRNPPLIIAFALAQWKDDNESKDEETD